MAMIEDGDRACPLCTEEMDLTDQQLKPCKCGYDICVWCWHQIMEMAEKEGSEGRCPACRTIYDKQRIIATDNCKRMVTEEKKQKSQRTKNKSLSTIEDRKQLSNVRVVQRNLAYIMGMPSNLADETILERKEYFGQYGKVLKVSISRQAGTTLPQASMNDTFNVYITYAREEEAIRCIQYVHNFVLEDRPLRACFGTTKYCYIWLRNMVCNNPDCVYLHDIGSQEDSFTKDEIISAYTRSRVPQIPSNCLQLRAGDVLPPPADDFHNNNTTTARSLTKNPSNITINQPKSSHVDTSSTSSTVLPSATSWASRVSSFRSPITSAANLQNSITQKIEIPKGTSTSPMNTNIKQKSAWHEDRSRVLQPLKIYDDGNNGNSRVQDVEYDSTSAWEDDMPSESISYRNQTVHANGKSTNALSISDSLEETSFKESRHSDWDDDIILNSSTDGGIKNVASGDKFRPLENDNEDPIPYDLSSSLDELNHANSPGDWSSSLNELNHVHLPCDLGSSLDVLIHADINVTENKESLHLDSDTHHGSNHIEMSQQKSMDTGHHLAENFGNLSLSLQQYRENEVQCLTSLPETDATVIHEEHVLSPSISYNHLTTSHNSEAADTLISAGETSSTWGSRNEPLYVNGISEPNSYTKNSLYLSDFDNNSYIDKYSNVHREEKSTVSDVLSSDFDPWDNSWSSANNFAELLAQMNHKHDASSKQSNSLMVQDANQSRFSFARQDNYQTNIGYGDKVPYSNQESYGNGGNTFPASNFERANMFGNNGLSSDATSGIARRKKSPPPGFTLPNTRAPPPGFSSPDRYETLNTSSDVRLLNSPLQNQFQIHPINNTADVEFIDPAILAVGKGRLPLGLNNVTGLSSRSSTFNPHFNTKDNDARIQLLMQQSIYSNHSSRSQNSIHEDRFLQRGDTYSNSRHSMQNPSISSYSPISHQQPLYNQSSQWNGWSATQMNNGMDDRFRLNSYFQSNDESKFHVSNSGDFYNRTFGI